MTIIEAVIARIEALASVTALVSNRIMATHLDQDVTKPAVLVQLIGKVETIHLRGPDNIKRARVQIDSVDLTKAGADDVALAVHGDGLGTQATGLSGWKGHLGGSPGVRIDCVRPAGEREHFEPPPQREYRVQRDYLVDFQGE